MTGTALADLTAIRQGDVLQAIAAVETADEPVRESAMRGLYDPALRATVARCLAESGRVLMKVGDGWLTGYDDQIGERFAREGLGVLTKQDRAVLTLALIHCVAIPRARGTISGESWAEAITVPPRELNKSQIPQAHISRSLQRLRDAGILRYGDKRGIRPGPQFLRLTPTVSQSLWQNLILLAQPDGVMADVIRRRRATTIPSTANNQPTPAMQEQL